MLQNDGQVMWWLAGLLVAGWLLGGGGGLLRRLRVRWKYRRIGLFVVFMMALVILLAVVTGRTSFY